jgi:hypothetical protein
MGAAQHEVSGKLAHRGAIDHQPKMRRFQVRTAAFLAMAHRHLQAGVMTLLACLDAFLHFRTDRMMHGPALLAKLALRNEFSGGLASLLAWPTSN